MKKIGILTSSFAGNGLFGCNYGAALQGYALVKKLRDLGYEAYDINYISENTYMPGQYSVLKRTLLRIKLLFNVKLIAIKLKSFRNRKKLGLLRNKFSTFITENQLVYNNGQFFSLEELSKESNKFFACITGSDVVWNPTLYKNKIDDGFYLNFTDKATKRIAYAPSIGISEMPEECKKDFKEKIRKFNAVSVREKTGAEIIKKEVGVDVPVVLDPTLLLKANDYKDILKVPENLPEHYIALYQFGNLDYVSKKIAEVKKIYKLPVVIIPSKQETITNAKCDMGPGEFIGVIKNADLVLSDSFHCSVFCLLMHTPFLTFYRTLPTPGKDINSRMTDLLNSVNLNRLMITPETEIDYNILSNIDFNSVDMLIDKKREQSIKYLLNALEE